MNRRHFLGTSVFAGTCSLLAPHASAIGANGKLRVAVVGVKGHGSSHINAIKSHPRVNIGNVIEYEGGTLTGGHRAGCVVKDKDGKEIKKFKGRQDHIHNWVDACFSGKQRALHGAENGHLSAALAHYGTHSLNLGKATDPEEINAALKDNAPVAEAFARMSEHLAANGLKNINPRLGVPLTIDPKTEKFVGNFADKADALDREHYRDEFKLPNA